MRSKDMSCQAVSLVILPYVETPLFAGYKKGKKPKGRCVTNPFAYFYILLGTIRSTGFSLHFLLHAKGCLASHISRDLAGMLLSFVAFVVRSYA